MSDKGPTKNAKKVVLSLCIKIKDASIPYILKTCLKKEVSHKFWPRGSLLRPYQHDLMVR